MTKIDGIDENDEKFDGPGEFAMNINSDYRPEAILDQASAAPHGVFITFTAERARNSFRTRLDKAIKKAKENWDGNPNGWADLLIRIPEGTELRLWIGPPSGEGLGITGVTEATEKCFD